MKETTLPRWRAKIGDYSTRETIGLQFKTESDRRKFVGACFDSESPLYKLPKAYPGCNTVIVPRDAVKIAQESGFEFEQIEVLGADEVTREEYLRLRKGRSMM